MAYRDPNGYRQWQRTKQGVVSRAYAAIKCRCKGRQKTASRYYDGLPFMTKKEFFAWSLSDPQFDQIHRAWVGDGHPPCQVPSIDRIVAEKGYVAGNLRWLPLSENISLGSRSDGNGVVARKKRGETVVFPSAKRQLPPYRNSTQRAKMAEVSQ